MKPASEDEGVKKGENKEEVMSRMLKRKTGEWKPEKQEEEIRNCK